MTRPSAPRPRANSLTAAAGLLRQRECRLFFSGQAASLFGDSMTVVALGFAVIRIGGGAASISVVLGAAMLSMVACLLVGGVVADRRSRRAVMVAADLVRFGSQGAIATLLVTGSGSVEVVAASAAVTGAGTGFFLPAATGLMPMVVEAERLQQANALRGLIMASARIVGPIVAGGLIAVLGAGWVLALDAATFGVSAVCLSRLRLQQRTTVSTGSGSFLVELREGWRTVRGTTWVWAMVTTSALTNCVLTAWLVLGPLISERALGGAAAWGLIMAALGGGGVAGGLLAMRLTPRRPLVVSILALSVMCIPLPLLALTAPVPVIVLGALVGGGAATLSNTLWETALQHHLPLNLLSRVSAYDWFGSMALRPLGFMVCGPIAASLGAAETLWLGFGLQVVAVLAVLAIPDVRGLPGYRGTPSEDASGSGVASVTAAAPSPSGRTPPLPATAPLRLPRMPP